MEQQMICYCKKVTLEMIQEAVENGAKTVEAVQEATGAGTACGRCKERIQEIVEA